VAQSGTRALLKKPLGHQHNGQIQLLSGFYAAERKMTRTGLLFIALLLAGVLSHIPRAGSDHHLASLKYYSITDGAVDPQTFNGYRRYHGACNHCHGPDGMGSTIASALIERLLDKESFRAAVLNGVARGGAVMKGFAGDPNVAPYVDDIYAYVQARADGVLPRGRPNK
jgi:mono/diheme cytochrome c family protein